MNSKITDHGTPLRKKFIDHSWVFSATPSASPLTSRIQSYILVNAWHWVIFKLKYAIWTQVIYMCWLSDQNAYIFFGKVWKHRPWCSTMFITPLKSYRCCVFMWSSGERHGWYWTPMLRGERWMGHFAPRLRYLRHSKDHYEAICRCLYTDCIMPWS